MVKQNITAKKDYIASMTRKISKMGMEDNITYYVVIPKPLVDSKVLDKDKEYDFYIKEVSQ